MLRDQGEGNANDRAPFRPIPSSSPIPSRSPSPCGTGMMGIGTEWIWKETPVRSKRVKGRGYGGGHMIPFPNLLTRCPVPSSLRSSHRHPFTRSGRSLLPVLLSDRRERRKRESDKERG